MSVSYARQTLDSPNPLARFAHRRRLRKSLSLAARLVGHGDRVLDYGCGSGAFLLALRQLSNVRAYGFEPFMNERVSTEINVVPTLDLLPPGAQFRLITMLEVIEHLSDEELDFVLGFASQALCPGGSLLISGPIMIGPALLLKEANRCLLHKRWPEHTMRELMVSSALGIAPSRAEDIKSSHKGFDFRRTFEHLQRAGWQVDSLGYGPVPLIGWYGNSQFYWKASVQ
jgi:2-polyprenyl-3-methyl-5-hydroxy-6-metoxy-1,4-benzoquinol methylase